MKRSRIILAWCVMAPLAAFGQDVRVRLYTNLPQENLVARAIEGEMRWKSCATCQESVGRELTMGQGAGGSGDDTGGSEFYLSGRYELRPTRGPSFVSRFPAHIELRDGHLLVTLTMPLEEYVADVLAAESGGFENAESQKAMAVVARTYAMRFLGQHAKDGFDFCDTTHCQAFGWKGAKTTVRSAVNATRGEVLRYDGKPAEAYYHQNCGGITAAASEVWPGVTEPYLTTHTDGYCAARGTMLWETTLRVAEIERSLRASALSTPAGWRTVEIVERSESGRALRLKLAGGTGGNSFVAGSTFRFAVNRALGWEKIRSNLFEVRSAGDSVVFSGRGSGHGVGLCQVGAEEMAREGKSYQEILNFYYPGTQIAAPALTNEVQWQKRSSERVELLSTQPAADSAILPIAERILKEEEEFIGWKANNGVELRVYPTLDAYRNTTGQPGWVAASTRGRTIRLQPLKELEKRAIVESTLRHEIFHVLVESKAKAATPFWFREGIVLFLANPSVQGAAPDAMADEQIESVLRQPKSRDELAKAYAAAQSRVAALVAQYGKDAVLGWLSGGIPGDVRGSAGSGSATPHH